MKHQWAWFTPDGKFKRTNSDKKFAPGSLFIYGSMLAWADAEVITFMEKACGREAYTQKEVK